MSKELKTVALDNLPSFEDFERNKLKAITELKDIQYLKISFIDKRDIQTTCLINSEEFVKSITEHIKGLLNGNN